MSNFARRTAAMFAACGLVVAGSAVLAPAATAGGPDCEYTAVLESSTSISASPTRPTVGDSFTVTANVNVGPAPATGGTVNFSYAGQGDTVGVVGGSASTTFTAVRGRNSVVAVYTGDCVAGEAAVVGGSQDGIGILGVAANNGNGGNNGNGNGGGNGNGVGNGGAGVGGTGTGIGGVDDGSSIGGLGDTGMTTSTQVLAAGGIALLALGGGAIAVNRRRAKI
jgi:LPXTG-motif cell wall-anchored protein